MNMSFTDIPFVSTKTIAEITGRVQFAAQRRMLKEMGIKFIESPSGRPLVHEDELRRHAVGGSSKTRPTLRN